MQITETLCDRCSSRGASGYGIAIGRQTDAAGSSEDITLDADLCPACVATIFSALLRESPKETTEKFLRNLRASKPIGQTVFTVHP